MIEHLSGTVISSSIQNESAVTAQRWLMDYKNRTLFLSESDNDVVNDTVVLIRINIINLHVSSPSQHLLPNDLHHSRTNTFMHLTESVKSS